MSHEHVFTKCDDASLRQWVGKQFIYQQHLYELHDLLLEEDSIILLSLEDRISYQDDSYGRASRAVPETIVLRIRDQQQQALSVCQELRLLSSQDT